MADLSKIKAPDGTEVDIKDATARSGLADKMDKANPTGTGTLSMNRKSSTTVGSYSVALGYNGTASGNYSTSLGNRTKAQGAESVAEGYSSTASGSDSHAEGYSTTASGASSHSEGSSTTASGQQSHAEGSSCTAAGKYSHAEGRNSSTDSAADASHAEGYGSVAYGSASHAEGIGCTATGNYSHAEGNDTTTEDAAAHAEGENTNAQGYASHAEGYGSVAKGLASHAEGYYTLASGHSQHAGGKYNIEDSDNTYAEIIGNGSDNARSNARTLDWNGNEWLAGGFECNGMKASSSAVTLINPEKWRDAIFDCTPDQSAKDRLLSRLTKGTANVKILEYGGYFEGSQRKRLKITFPSSGYGKYQVFIHMESNLTQLDYEMFISQNSAGTALERAAYGKITPTWTSMAGTAATGDLTWTANGLQVYSSIFDPYGGWYIKIIAHDGAATDIPNVYYTNES